MSQCNAYRFALQLPLYALTPARDRPKNLLDLLPRCISRLRTFRVVQAHMLILVQSIKRIHLLGRELEPKNVEIGQDPLWSIGFGEGDEPVTTHFSLSQGHDIEDSYLIGKVNGGEETDPRCKLHRINTCAQLFPVSSAIRVKVGSEALVP